LAAYQQIEEDRLPAVASVVFNLFGQQGSDAGIRQAEVLAAPRATLSVALHDYLDRNLPDA
jgi:hypothetical protein